MLKRSTIRIFKLLLGLLVLVVCYFSIYVSVELTKLRDVVSDTGYSYSHGTVGVHPDQEAKVNSSNPHSDTLYTNPTLSTTTNRTAIIEVREDENLSTKTSTRHDDSVCPQNDRLTLIANMCQKHFKTRPGDANWTDELSDHRIRALAVNFQAMDEFKILKCNNWKTGSSTWSWIVFNNTAPQPLPTDADFLDVEARAKKSGAVKDLDQYSVGEIRHRFKTYFKFKFMSVRHPMDRLVSAYVDKLINHVWYRKRLGPKILQKYHPNLTKEQRENGTGVTFLDFIRYISEGGRDIWGRSHWHDQIQMCQPCVVPFDYIVRTETHDHDASYIILEKLRGRGLRSRHKAWREKATSYGRELPEFKDIPDRIFQKISAMYRKDLETYGYSFTRDTNGAVHTKCDIDGHSCC